MAVILRWPIAASGSRTASGKGCAPALARIGVKRLPLVPEKRFGRKNG